MIWRISESLRWSQNFVKNWKFSWPRSLAKFLDFDYFFIPFVSDLWVNCKSENGILKCSFIDLKHFWKFEVESKFCRKLKIFMTAVISEISDFDHFSNILISDLWVNCKSQNGILKCSFVHLKHFWKFEVKSKFCQKLKIFMTAVLSEIFRFWLLFHPFRFWPVSELQVWKWYSKVFFCWFEAFLKVWGEVNWNFFKNWKFSWPRSLAKFQILTTFSSLLFLTCEWIASLKMVF